jgi:hypothetical protein
MQVRVKAKKHTHQASPTKEVASMIGRAAGSAGSRPAECLSTHALRLDAHLVIAGAGAEACPTPAALVASTVQV